MPEGVLHVGRRFPERDAELVVASKRRTREVRRPNNEHVSIGTASAKRLGMHQACIIKDEPEIKADPGLRFQREKTLEHGSGIEALAIDGENDPPFASASEHAAHGRGEPLDSSDRGERAHQDEVVRGVESLDQLVDVLASR